MSRPTVTFSGPTGSHSQHGVKQPLWTISEDNTNEHIVTERRMLAFAGHDRQLELDSYITASNLDHESPRNIVSIQAPLACDPLPDLTNCHLGIASPRTVIANNHEFQRRSVPEKAGSYEDGVYPRSFNGNWYCCVCKANKTLLSNPNSSTCSRCEDSGCSHFRCSKCTKA